MIDKQTFKLSYQSPPIDLNLLYIVRLKLCMANSIQSCFVHALRFFWKFYYSFINVFSRKMENRATIFIWKITNCFTLGEVSLIHA